MNAPPDPTPTRTQPGAAATRWLGRRLAWEHRLAQLRDGAAGTPRLTPRVRAPAPDRRVA